MSLFPSSIRPGRLMLYLLLGLTAATTCLSCRRQYTPKPDAYFRIDPYPETYRRTTLPGTRLSFEIPEGTTEALDPDSTHRHDGVQWLNIRFPRYRATLYCSYHPLRGNLDRLTDESRELVYRQSIRPDVVQAGHYENDSLKIYATLYDLSCGAGRPLRKRQFEDLCHPLRPLGRECHSVAIYRNRQHPIPVAGSPLFRRTW